jgi:hypothetical protein
MPRALMLAFSDSTTPAVEGDYNAWYSEEHIEDDEGVQRFANSLKAALSDGAADISPHINMQNITATFCIPITDRVSHDAPVTS